MKKILQAFLPFIIFFASNIGHAQTGWTYLQSSEAPLANDIIQLSDSSYVSCGALLQYGYLSTNPFQFYANKLNKFGSLQWETIIEKPVGSLYSGFHKVIEATDHKLILSGADLENYKPWVVALHEDGSIAWNSEDITDFPSYSSQYGLPIVVETTTEIVVISVQLTTEYIVNIFHLNSSTGEMISTSTIPTPAEFEGWFFMNDYTSTEDNGAAITGHKSAGGPSFVWKLNDSFETEWVYEYNPGAFFGYPSPLALGIKEVPDEGFIICGLADVDPILNNDESFILHLDQEGNFIWDNQFSCDPDMTFAHGIDIANNQEDGFLLLQYEQNPTTLENRAQIIYINTDGEEIHRLAIDNFLGFDYFTTIKETSDEGFIFAGYISEADFSNSKYFIQKSFANDSLTSCVFDCIWPGDADNSSSTTMDDILALGISFGTTGPSREIISNDWAPFAGSDWITYLPDLTNHKFTDCNGDGMINSEDTSAVDLNYSFEHPINIFKTTDEGIPLFIQDPGTISSAGTYALPIILGDAMNPANDIYGIRFTVHYEGESLLSSSVKIQFNDSWFASETEILQLDKNNPNSFYIDAAIVRNNQFNVSGFGEIGTLQIVVIDNIAGKENDLSNLKFSISNVKAIQLDMNELPIAAGITEIGGIDAIQQIETNSLTFYPNPTISNKIYFNNINKVEIETIDIYSATGTFIKTIPKNEIENNYLEISDLELGMYLLKIFQGESTFIQKMIKIKE